LESVATGNVAACFSLLSNILGDPVILTCPLDTKRLRATNFASLENSNISYFIALDAVETQPQIMLSGDDNLMVNGKRVQSGILNLHTNDSLAWTAERHQGAGNILLGDGSVQQASSDDLTSAARFATNRLAIP
jgi:prepilin-type processing-associated H-X9-DG protein